VKTAAAREDVPRAQRVAGLDEPVDGPAAVATRPRDRRSLAVPALVAGAWATLLVADATGAASALHHHALIEDGPPLAIAVPLFLVGWVVMVAAMMLPASLPTIRIVEAASSWLSRPRRARAEFLASFALVWTAFGFVVFLGDLGLHRVVDAMPALAARPWLIEAAILALAGAYQFVPLTRRSLAACRHPLEPEVRASLRLGGASRLGVSHGLACLGSSWALMLLMFAEGFASLGWMVALAGLMAYETSGRYGRQAASVAGVALVVAAIAVVSASSAPGL